MTRMTAALSAVLTLALLTGCATGSEDARGSTEPRGRENSEARTEPVGYSDTFDISSAVKVGIGTSLVADPSVLTIAVPNQPGDATFELSEEHCSLRLVQVAAAAVGATFTNDDVENSITVTLIFHGVESPIQRPRLTWAVNEGEGSMGAHSSLFADDDGAQTLTVSRGVGSISQLFYSELSCAPGVDAVEVYTRSVMPRIWIDAE